MSTCVHGILDLWKKKSPSTVLYSRGTCLDDNAADSPLHPPGPCSMVTPSIRLSAASMDP